MTKPVSTPPIHTVKVTSSQIAEIGHDPQTNTLAIRFNPRTDEKAGPLYHYANVPPSLYEEFSKAESVGSYFYKHIKPAVKTFPYVKVEAAVQEEA